MNETTGQAVLVLVEGVLCKGQLLLQSDGRSQVRFRMGDDTYVRWFDTEALIRP